ncbi:MAG: HD-GYP domain-containing protein [Bacteriovoracia bacterium]
MAKYDAGKYFTAPVSNLKSGTTIPFDLHLFLKLNGKIIVYKRKGVLIDQALLEKLKAFGVTEIHVSNEEKGIYESYLTGAPAKPTSPPQPAAPPPQPVKKQPESAAPPSPPAPPPPPPDPELNKINMIAEENKPVAIEKSEAAKMVSEIFNSESPEKSKPFQDMKAKVKDVLAVQNKDLLDTFAAFDAIEKPHSQNTAIYSVLFSFGLGYKDSKSLVEMVYSSLVHDVGLTQIPNKILRVPTTQRTPEQQKEYEKHVIFGLEELKQIGLQLPEKIHLTVLEHHEKFNGTGYPNKKEGFHIDELAQILSFSDLLCDISLGGYDGKKRSLKEALEMIITFEADMSFPKYFNPDLFSKLVKFIKDGITQNSITAASSIVDVNKKKLAA